MNKKLEKGFSLVELLVVVAIIGVLAGVGIVGYQSYTESAKEKVAEANYNSVIRFVETELTLLNNGVQENSGALKNHTTSSCAGTGALPRAATTGQTLAYSVACHFKDLKFKNPFDNLDQVKAGTAMPSTAKKGEIHIFPAPTGENTSGNNRPINIIYFTAAASSAPTFDSATSQYSGSGFKQKVDLGLAN
jgi:prepilin-type N-terminal cleavage/methylation domain-containing protein